MFVMYIVADFCWLYFEPEAIPSLHNAIYFHHVVTLVLLMFPLFHPEFSSFTCLDGELPLKLQGYSHNNYLSLNGTRDFRLWGGHYFEP